MDNYLQYIKEEFPDEFERFISFDDGYKCDNIEFDYHYTIDEWSSITGRRGIIKEQYRNWLINKREENIDSIIDG